ncbi:hypothetical protein IMZ48_23245 [Candidatus Bathyarchaeota archaeon]|nr:hypothetical protein [Candidatus Bathyarchaeota archaeon]
MALEVSDEQAVSFGLEYLADSGPKSRQIAGHSLQHRDPAHISELNLCCFIAQRLITFASHQSLDSNNLVKSLLRRPLIDQCFAKGNPVNNALQLQYCIVQVLQIMPFLQFLREIHAPHHHIHIQ